MSYPYILQGDNITIIINNSSHTINKSHVSYEKILEAIKTDNWQVVENIIDPKKALVEGGANNVSVKGDVMYWKEHEFHNAMSIRMWRMMEEGFPIEPLINFMDNLMMNPSYTAVNELYGFLEKNNLPITSDGHFLAYKKVKGNYLDCYTRTIDNSVGQVVQMERFLVDDNRHRTCSKGLHFCSKEYLNHYNGEKIMILKINPMDVVSIPTDYNNSKGRCCKYEVIGELGVKPENAFTDPVQDSANSVE